MAPIRSYRDLEVWQKAIELAVSIHRLVQGLARIERFRLGDQVIRAAVSIAANIAEGYGRRRRAEYIRFLDIANGSRCEVETHLEVLARLNLTSLEVLEGLSKQSIGVGQMLSRLRFRLAEGRS